MSSSLDTPVIILNWNGWDDSLACLESVARADGARNVWLVDNGSAVSREEEVAARFPSVRIILLGENYGWAGGYNRALEIAQDEGYRTAYLLNSDAVVDEGFLREVHDTYASNANVASVGSCIVRTDGLVKFDGEYRDGEIKRFEGPVRTHAVVDTNNGCGMLIDLEIFSQSGGFDEAFFCYGEEAEWCERAGRAGYLHLVARSSVVWHQCEGSNIGANSSYYRSRNRYLQRVRRSGRMRVVDYAQVTYRLWREVNEARRVGDRLRRDAILQAIIDGSQQRFGKRQQREVPSWILPLAYTWLLPPGTFWRWKARLSALRGSSV